MRGIFFVLSTQYSVLANLEGDMPTMDFEIYLPSELSAEERRTALKVFVEIAQAMSLRGLSLIIDSFHDNIEWKVHEKA